MADVSDLMRRMVKEKAAEVRRDSAISRADRLHGPLPAFRSEAPSPEAVTNYVREEFNRADALKTTNAGTVGFALTILQRRLAFARGLTVAPPPAERLKPASRT